MRTTTIVLLLLCGGCMHLKPAQRAQLARPEMRLVFDPAVDQQRESIYETTEGGTFPSAGSGATTGWLQN